MGVLAGVPDLLFWHDGWFGGIELKTGSSLSDKQKAFKSKFEFAGGKYATCKSVKEVCDTLMLWGVKPHPYQMKEPLPPIEVRYKAAMEFFKP